MCLCNAKKFSIIAKAGSRYRTFEVVLSNCEHPLNIENNSISHNVDGHHDDTRGMQSNASDLVMSLEWEDSSSIIGQIDLLHVVENRRVQQILVEEDIASLVVGAEEVLGRHLIVEYHLLKDYTHSRWR